MIRTLAVTEFDQNQAATVWDVRDAKAYAEGHLAGAVNMPLDQISSVVLAAVPIDQPIYVLCGGGTKAGRAVALIESLDGSRDVVELKGGTRGAKAAGMVMAIEKGVV